MALAYAQLTSAITTSTVQFALSNISSSASLPAVGGPPLSVGVPMQIGSEVMFVVQQPVAGTVVVRGRGADGTAVAAHDALSFAYFSSNTTDFPLPLPGAVVAIDTTVSTAVDVGTDSTITASGSQTYNINKATAAAITLNAPSLAINGAFVVFTSTTAAAHVITATLLLSDGSAGSPKTTATFVAGKGASLSLVAENGLWTVNALQNVTIS